MSAVVERSKHKPYLGIRTTPRRAVELVAIAPDQHGEQLRVVASVSRRGQFVRAPFEHDETPAGLADALNQVADWIRKGAP